MKQHCVFHVVTGLSTGGAERALYNLLHGGLVKQFNNYVISLIDRGTMGSQIEDLGVPVISLGLHNGRPSFSSFKKLRSAVRKFQPYIIQGWMYHGNLAASLACTMASRRPALAWNVRHSLYDLTYEKPMTRQVIRGNRFFSSGPNALLYNSSIARKQHEEFGFYMCNSQVIPNGIDVKKFCFSREARQRICFELGIPLEAQIVGHVGRFHPMKDHPNFLRAAVKLAFRYPNVHFLLAGRKVSMANKGLVQMIPAQVRSRFYLLDERNDASDLMSAMDVCTSSSFYGEGFSNVLGEAMASSVPCVATDVGDSAIIIGNTGVLVPPQDENALAAGIEKILTMPVEERRSLGVCARTRIEENYTLGSIVERYVTLYRELMPNNRVS